MLSNPFRPCHTSMHLRFRVIDFSCGLARVFLVSVFASNTSKIWCTFSLTNRYFAKGYSFDGILTIIFIVPLGVYFFPWRSVSVGTRN